MTGIPARSGSQPALDVLLLDAEHRQSLASMRVLADHLAFQVTGLGALWRRLFASAGSRAVPEH
jgi:hypothetical protein